MSEPLAAELDSPTVPNCEGPDCDKPARRQGLCWGHAWQKHQNRPLKRLRARNQSPMEVAYMAAIDLGNAETDEEFELCKARLRMAIARIRVDDLT
jgi:hypothetical protein